ncbi:MarR family transcriptional regulator [Candidatus Dependentiae bacterium]|nr:MarR family transcriptional regulator [Candidatus Dependentiae bacterium]
MKKVAWKEVSQFEGPDKSPGFLLWQVSTGWRRKIEAVLSTIGLTHPQFVLLASVGWLTRNQVEISQVELARHCGTDITMTSQVLRSLEKKGFVERKQKKGDERSKYPKLTKKGAELVEKALPLVEAVDHNFFDTLGHDLSKCIEILQKLSE